MKQYTNPLFEKALSEVPEYRKRLARTSFDISDRIQTLMLKKGWNKTQLAQKTGKDNAEVTRWLSGGQNFTLKTISLLETVFNAKIITVKQ